MANASRLVPAAPRSIGNAGGPAAPPGRMAEQPGRVSIDSLHLHVEGGNAASGRRLASAVVERLARGLPRVGAAELDRLELRVELPAGASEAATVEAVTRAVARSLARRSGRPR